MTAKNTNPRPAETPDTKLADTKPADTNNGDADTTPHQKNYGVVVVSFGSHDELATFVESLDHSTHRPTNIVVVENGPTLPPLTALADITTTLHRSDNPGYGGAINAGVAHLDNDLEWVLISNPDVVLEPEAIRALMAVAQSSPTIGAVGPALVNPDGSIYPSARAVPSLSVGTGHALFAALWPANPWTASYRGTYDSTTPRPCGWLSGACLLVRRSAFDAVGGFDEGYFMFMEDVDLGMRLGTAGWSSVYVPEARAEHTVGHSTGGAKHAMAQAHHRSARRFIAKRYPGPYWFPLRTFVGLGLSVRQRIVQLLAARKPQH